jgi:hypothetical protein
MSTRLEDLPGESEYEYNNKDAYTKDTYNKDAYIQPQNVNMDIKKVRFKDPPEEFENTSPPSLLSSILSQFSEENILVLGILFLASRNEINNVITNVPYLGSLDIAKPLVLFIFFILFKIFILPMLTL